MTYHLHCPGTLGLLLRIHLVPLLDSRVPLDRMWLGIWLNESKLLQPSKSSLPKYRRSLVILPLVLLTYRRWSLQWPVRSGECVIGKEGFVPKLGISFPLVKEFEQMVGEGGRRVEAVVFAWKVCLSTEGERLQ